MSNSDNESYIQVSVVQNEEDDPLQVGIFLLMLDKVIVLSAKNARDFAFKLMECSDEIEPPFESNSEEL